MLHAVRQVDELWKHGLIWRLDFNEFIYFVRYTFAKLMIKKVPYSRKFRRTSKKHPKIVLQLKQRPDCQLVARALKILNYAIINI